jgi:RHS repeat-associated protein
LTALTLGFLSDTYANDPNLMRRPASISVTTPTSVSRWTSGTYTYDGAGNVKAIGTHTFTYDKVSRLTAANLYLKPTASTTLRTQTFGYDAFGNLLTFGGSSARNTPTAPATNHLTGATYDASGNVTTWNGNAYTYDPFHLMWDYKTPSDEWIYLYSADDERAWSYKTDNTSLWTLRGLDAKVLREYTTNGTWSVAEDYIYRNGLLLAAETPAGTRHFHLDHLGTPRLVSNNLGQQAAYHVYYPFGEEATAFNQDTIRAKFTGHERDLGNPGGAGDDLDYMHARHESGWTGRFLGIDRISGNPARPQSWNKYDYAKNSPLNYIDPDGRCAVPSGLQQGQVGICIESFISSPRIGGVGFGDNRSFTPNDSSATFRTSLRMIIDPKTGNILRQSKEAGTSEVGITKPLVGLKGTTTLTGGSSTDNDGVHHYSFFITGLNGFSALNSFGVINILVNMSVDQAGKVSVNSGSSAKGFPSIEGFAYKIIQGELVVQVLFKVQEQDPSKLNGPLNVPLAPPQ